MSHDCDCEDCATRKAIVERARYLQRGCTCDYDYRCRACQTVLDILDMLDKVKT